VPDAPLPRAATPVVLPPPPRPGERPPIRNARLAALLAEPLTQRSLDALEAQLQVFGVLTLPALENGLYAAVPRAHASNAYTGYGNTWVRDTVQIAQAAWDSGQVGSAAATARALATWFSRQAPRFEACIAGTADVSDPMQRPHIRFRGASLEELPEWWPHAQNDALGYALWFLARAALSGLLPLDAFTGPVLLRFPRYFAAIRYWQDRDSGHWEEARKLECSSVGAVVAGLLALRGLLRSRSELLDLGARSSPPVTPALLDELLAAGRAHLARVLPRESQGEPDPTLDRDTDAALLFLVHPLRVVDDAMAARICDDVRARLLGVHGIRRYAGDSYWMADYARLFDEQTRTSGFEDDVGARDRHLLPGTEAQWCLFDPVLSVIHGWRFLASRDPRERELQEWHLLRSLGQITGDDCALGPGLCPEAYCMPDSREPGRWIANDDTPLLWTQACVVSALGAARRTLAAASQ